VAGAAIPTTTEGPYAILNYWRNMLLEAFAWITAGIIVWALLRNSKY